MKNSKKKLLFFLLSVCCIVFNSSWKLKMFNKKQKTYVKRIHLVTDDDIFDQKAFYRVKMVFNHPL